MTDYVLSAEELEALRNLRTAASELVTNIPYITMTGNTVTRQNILVQALATALEASRSVDFESPKELTHAAPERRRTRTAKN